jgi:hypothetical protein
MAVVVGALYLALGSLALHYGSPHEDAYILFRYAKHLTGGEGIVFYPGGPHAEGATDFLWLLLIGVFGWLSLSPPYAALFLNAVSLFVTVVAIGGLLQVMRQSDEDHSEKEVGGHILAFLTPLFVLLPSSLAGFVGFSAPFFCAAILLLYGSYLYGSLRVLPYLALIVGLIRPDGVVLGVLFGVLGLSEALRRRTLSPYLISSGIAVFLGASYFLGRMWYFGEFLPLPLYVKDVGGSVLPGARENVTWLWRNQRYFFVLGFLVFFLPTARVQQGGSSVPRRALLGLFPLFAHFLVLSFALQSQNVAYRFQAPFVLVLVAVSFLFAGGHLSFYRERVKRIFLISLLGAVFLFHLPEAMIVSRLVTQGSYLDSFAPAVGKLLPSERTVALTEAGRFPYWGTFRAIDLVGLNTAETAKEGASVPFLEKVAPDIIFFHDAELMALPQELKEQGEVEGVVRVPAFERSFVIRSMRGAVERLQKRELLSSFPRVELATLASVAYLLEHPDEYDLYGVRYQGRIAHYYGVRRSLPERGPFLEALRGTVGGR